MEAKNLTPEAAAAAAIAATASQTLAAGELVWAKPSKPRRHCWWPARMLAACPASAVRDAQVSYFSDPAAPGKSAPPSQVRRFADADADTMARGSAAGAFYLAVQEAHARAVAALRTHLTCPCVQLPAPPPGEDSSVAGVANLAPAEFLAALREAALDVSSVGLLDRARLKSWARAFGEGWGPHGAQYNPRRSLDDLVDKIDLDVPAGEDRDADDWLAEDQPKALLERPEETPMQKKRSVTKVMGKLDAGKDEDKNDSPEHVTSGKRERKRSKYLSPPYTTLGVVEKITRKPVDQPKALVPKAAEDGSNVLPLPDSIVVEDVLLLVRGLGEVSKHRDDFPKDAEEFLRLFRSTTFVEGADSCKGHECPLMRGSRNVGMDIAVGLISDSLAVREQDSCVSKRGRKKDDAGSGGSSTKRKKQEKTSPAATNGASIPITPAISKEATMHDADIPPAATIGTGIPIASAIPITPAISKEPTMHDADIHPAATIDTGIPIAPAIPITPAISKEAVMPDADILQSAADLPVSSALSPMHEDVSQPLDENKEPVGVEVCTVQQSYASLQAMVPEMLKEVNTNGTDIIGVNHTLKDECQKDGQPVKKVKLPAEVANHSCNEGTNGTCLDPGNLTPKKKKKTAQYFSNPAAVIVEFVPGAIVPSREELLSTFGKYGYVIESQTDISEASRSACVVFGKSIEAEEAYKNGCQYLLGQFGPPFAKIRLDFSPIKLTVPSPSLASKPPLKDIRKNLEDMISARRSSLNKTTSSDGQLNPVPDKLLEEMQGLLAKVDRMLTRPPSNTP